MPKTMLCLKIVRTAEYSDLAVFYAFSPYWPNLTLIIIMQQFSLTQYQTQIQNFIYLQ